MQEQHFHLSLVIPIYNEAGRLHLMEGGLVELAHDASQFQIEVVMVDDGSRDNTWEDLQALEKEFPEKHGVSKDRFHVRSLQQIPNAGKGVALQKGVKEARGDWILTLDADMAARPIEVLKWQKEGQLDLNDPSEKMVMIGSREHPKSIVIDKSGRRIMGRVFNALTRTISGLPLRDTQCGFKLYPANLAKETFAKLIHTGWAHDVEILMRVQHQGHSIKPLPVHWTAIEGSKINPLKDAWDMFWEIVKIRFNLNKEFKKD